MFILFDFLEKLKWSTFYLFATYLLFTLIIYYVIYKISDCILNMLIILEISTIYLLPYSTIYVIITVFQLLLS